MPWQWIIKTGTMNHNEDYFAKGYAGGNCGKSPEGVNNPDMVNVPNVGPLPPGKYTFGTPVDHTHLGPFAIPLNPNPENEMFGRNGFYCHGDTAIPGNASEGCIILARTYRNAIASSPDKELEVITGV